MRCSRPERSFDRSWKFGSYPPGTSRLADSHPRLLKSTALTLSAACLLIS